MTKTPLSEQMEPKIFPAMVFGTMSPYLGIEKKKIVLSYRKLFPSSTNSFELPVKWFFGSIYLYFALFYPPANAGHMRDMGSILGRKDPPEEDMAIHSSMLVWKSHGQRSLAGYSPSGHKESDKIEVT